MKSDNAVSNALSILVANVSGIGMAVMFLCTGITGFIICCISYKNREIQKLNE